MPVFEPPKTLLLEEKQLEILVRKKQVTHKEIKVNGWLWIPQERRLYMPLFNRLGEEIGVCKRYFKELNDDKTINGPKALTYWKPEEKVHIHFPKNVVGWSQDTTKEATTILLVEDIISAVLLNRQIRTAALLGNNIPHNALLSLYNCDIFLCLDQDASINAITLLSKYKLLFNSCNVILLTKDPKDMSWAERNKEIFTVIEEQIATGDD